MEALFEFYPYKNNKSVLPFAVITMLVFLVILLLHFNLFVFMMALMNAWVIKFLCASLHTNILFYHDGIRIHESKHKGIFDFTWEQVRYGYHTKNFKGHSFFLLAPNKLTEKQLHQYTNKSANTDSVCIDDIVVFPIENSQYSSELERFIYSKVIIVD